MPSRRAYYALLLGAVTALAASSWAQNVSNDIAPSKEASDSYTVQSGDTLSRISRRFGVPADALMRANDLSHPDRLTAGHVLRLPVTSPRPPAAQPPREQTAPTPQAQPPQPQPAPAQPVKTPQEEAAPRAQPTAMAPAAASPGNDVEIVPVPEAARPNRAGDIEHQAAGLYRHPTLGTLRLSPGPDGLLLAKNNQDIALRRLLYAIYDGADATGYVHTIDLVFDAEGHVTTLRYSGGGTGQVTFEKVKR